MKKKIYKMILCFLITFTILSPLISLQTYAQHKEKNMFTDDIQRSHLPNKCAFSGNGSKLETQRITAAIDLSFVTNISLTLYTQYDIHGSDSCKIDIKVDAGPWESLDILHGTTTNWTLKTYDLDAMAGHIIRIRFLYVSGINSSSNGTYLDMIQVIGDDLILYDEDFEGYSIGAFWEDWVIVEKTRPNQPPRIPSNPSPTNNTIYISINQDLSWSGGDNDAGDTVTYDVYFGVDSPPALLAQNITSATYTLDRLSYETQYYWQICAWDTFNEKSTGPLWTFKTIDNAPPTPPSNPYPANGSTFVDFNITLNWTGGDIYDDPVSYDLYFDTARNPSLLATDLNHSNYTLNTLANDTQYYWRVVAQDAYDATSAGPLWTFRTGDPSNQPPLKPETPDGPTTGRIQISYSYETTTTDPNLDQLYYLFDWDDGTTSGWIGPYASGQTVASSHVWNTIGSFHVKVKAKDDAGYESTWSDPLPISMPKKSTDSFFDIWYSFITHSLPLPLWFNEWFHSSINKFIYA